MSYHKLGCYGINLEGKSFYILLSGLCALSCGLGALEKKKSDVQMALP